MGMNWHNEPWRKLYTRITGEWMQLSLMARGMADELLKYTKDDGFVCRTKGKAPALALALVLSPHPHEIEAAETAAAELIDHEYALIVGDEIRIKNFSDAQEKRSAAAVRQKRHRERNASVTPSDNSPEEEEKQEDESVTDQRNEGVMHDRDTRYAMSQGNETRRDETKRDPPVVPLTGDLFARGLDLGTARNKKQRARVDGHLGNALAVLDALNAARKRVRPTSSGIKPSYTSLAHIAHQLATGKSLDMCKAVVLAVELECKKWKPRGADDKDPFDFFNSVTPFRPDPFERLLAKAPAVNVSSIRETAADRALAAEQRRIEEAERNDRAVPDARLGSRPEGEGRGVGDDAGRSGGVESGGVGHLPHGQQLPGSTPNSKPDPDQCMGGGHGRGHKDGYVAAPSECAPAALQGGRNEAGVSGHLECERRNIEPLERNRDGSACAVLWSRPECTGFGAYLTRARLLSPEGPERPVLGYGPPPARRFVH